MKDHKCNECGLIATLENTRVITRDYKTRYYHVCKACNYNKVRSCKWYSNLKPLTIRLKKQRQKIQEVL